MYDSWSSLAVDVSKQPEEIPNMRSVEDYVFRQKDIPKAVSLSDRSEKIRDALPDMVGYQKRCEAAKPIATAKSLDDKLVFAC